MFAEIGTGGVGIAVIGSVFSGNVAGYGGGLLVKSYATLPTAKTTISGTKITTNISNSTGANGGGGLFVGHGNTVITGSLIGYNTAIYDGGGIDASGFASLTISASSITGNLTASASASFQGGGRRCFHRGRRLRHSSAGKNHRLSYHRQPLRKRRRRHLCV